MADGPLMGSVPSIIAIDGPAASGKTTVGSLLADELGYLCLDTGIMYRAITWKALADSINPNNEQEVTRLAQSIDIDVKPMTVQDGRQFDVIINNEDRTWEIRLPEVNQNVSVVSAYPEVRDAMTLQQRKIAERGKIVMLGRDIGSVVLPHADLKIYLDASVRVRAQRRYDEEKARGNQVNLDEIIASLERRDKIDSTRKFAPLKVADDAVVINTDNLTILEVLDAIKSVIQLRQTAK
ncbi:MAG: (d)CMP kinase [Anaerolineaceae bacterium]